MQSDVLHCELSSGSGYVMDWHTHDCHMLLVPRRGSLLLSTECSQADMRLSSLSFSAVGLDIGHATSAACRKQSHLTLYVEPDYLRRYGPRHAGTDLQAAIAQAGQWARSDVLDAILLLYDRIEASPRSPSREPDLHAGRQHHLNHLLFDECMRIIARGERLDAGDGRGNNALLIRQVQQFIDEHLEQHHDLDTLCRQFHLSRRHLTRLFRDIASESVVDYTNRRRVEQAQRLIGERGMSVLQAGLAVGIESPSYLARLFKKHLGLLPSDCRKVH
ncbi:AraC family transcriptional regulator [Herbaspirillum sp. YR522]|uniref:AraC family transcriptional regulator n=1 Tax=Herbaspirillum sp. YR522 TaxID=1144342 RepID=UPI0002D438E2|nr:AraC family transcriptional regulator [Herbaspirillum sp. YR522]